MSKVEEMTTKEKARLLKAIFYAQLVNKKVGTYKSIENELLRVSKLLITSII